MVFRKVKKEEKIEDESNEESIESEKENPKQQKTVQIPVFPTQAEVNRWIYENNVMLHAILDFIDEEKKEKEN